MRKTVITTAAALAMGVPLVLAAVAADAAGPIAPSKRLGGWQASSPAPEATSSPEAILSPSTGNVEVQPCATEDSAGPCYWDASSHGNGKGRSFYTLPDGTMVQHWAKVDGHADCWALVGPTSVVKCADGWVTTS